MPSRPPTPCQGCGRATPERYCDHCQAARADAGYPYVTVITGPPCSGKTTYAKTHARPGDMVVDWDALAVALGSPADHGHHPALTPFLIAARHALLDRLREPHDLSHVWVIATDPRPIRSLLPGCQVIVMATDRDECKRRAVDDGRPAGWLDLIERWDGHL